MIESLRDYKGINNLIYRGFIPFCSLIFIVLQLIFADWSTYCKFVNSLYNVFFLAYVALFFGLLPSFIDCYNINEKINSKIGCSNLLKDNVTVLYGAPGTGKSLVSFSRGLEMAEKLWEDLQIEYWYLSSVIENKRYNDQALIKKRWRAVSNAYNFWNNFKGIKCFGCNMQVQQNGLFNFSVSKKHIEQRKFLPQFIVIVIEEAGSIFPTTESNVNNKNYRGEDKLRFCRHRNTWFILNEQNPTNMTNYIRNVVSKNYEMTGCNWLYEPILLKKILKCLENFGRNSDEFGLFTIFCYKFKNFINSLGYFKIKFNVKGNLETGDGQKIDEGIEYLHHKLSYKYDTYAYSNIDQSKDLKEENNIVKNFGLNNSSEIVKEIYERYQNQDDKIVEKQEKKNKRNSK